MAHEADRIDIEGSGRTWPQGAQRVARADSNERVGVSVYLRRKDEAGLLDGEADHGKRRARVAHHRGQVHRADFDAIAAWAAGHGLTVAEEVPARRYVRLEGTVGQFEAALGTELHVVEHAGGRFRGREGTLKAPRHIAEAVESVLGLDNRPVASAKFKVLPHDAAAGSSHLPNTLAKFYDFPTGVTGTGETIALIELGGGYEESDITAAFKAMGLTAPSVSSVSVSGGSNTPGSDADGEVALDIQVAGGLAPGADIVVYFSPNTDQGFADAISTAAAASATSVISISWGGPESSWTSQSVTSMNSAIEDAGNAGISVFVASGDSLATDGVSDGAAHVDFPASSPYAIGCGGTQMNTSGTAVTSEVVWNDGDSGTGGGYSALFTTRPAFQSGISGGTGRGVPDVSGDAAPSTGYTVVVDGQTETVGGTSAVAPLWAGLTALVNQSLGRRAGFFLAAVYGDTSGFVDITSGTNKPSGSDVGFSAGTGWDPCTGLGRPDGQKLLAVLQGTAATS